MSDLASHWDERFRGGNNFWDTDRPDPALQRMLDEAAIQPCRALELGCGTGTNALFLAQQGFDVTAVDVVPQALERAEAKARQAGVSIHFTPADVLQLPDLGKPFPFVFDRGTYHILRQVDLERFRHTLAQATEPGSMYLTLAGNANEPNPPEGGPPRVHAHEICLELAAPFDLVQ